MLPGSTTLLHYMLVRFRGLVTGLVVRPERMLENIERGLGRKLPRTTVPGFDYARRPAEKLEIPLGARLAQFRARQGAGRAAVRRRA